jgi:ppGpp synthetase/RelA/SpoT-type nucleotidyltranferase
MREVKSAEDFIRDYGRDYRDLLNTVVDVCERVQQTLDADVINSIYSRDKSGGGNIFKEPGKIANKVRQNGGTPGTKAYLELNDIVGLTVVVKYPDGIPQVIKAIRLALKPKRIKVGRPEEHKDKGGYFATHVVCSSVFAAETLNCEVQLKSLLHDAWSAKMHDLTYKPTGVLDPKLNALMASVASTIESLERQSILIRDMIKANWNVEEYTRRVAREQLFASMRSYGAKAWKAKAGTKLDKLRLDIENSSALISIEPKDGKTVKRLTRAVEQCCRDPAELRFGWIMAGRIASLRTSPDLVRFFSTQVDAWLAVAAELLKKRKIDKIEEKEIGSVPLLYYVIGDLDRAIEYAEYLNADPAFSALSKGAKMNIAFNRANYLIEREYHQPTKNPAMRQALKAQIGKVLRNPRLGSMSTATKPDSSIEDTRGLMKITFATNQDDARAGIEQCVKARGMSPLEEKAVSDAYADLNLRLGWRRYFELEGK